MIKNWHHAWQGVMSHEPLNKDVYRRVRTFQPLLMFLKQQTILLFINSTWCCVHLRKRCVDHAHCIVYLDLLQEPERIHIFPRRGLKHRKTKKQHLEQNQVNCAHHSRLCCTVEHVQFHGGRKLQHLRVKLNHVDRWQRRANGPREHQKLIRL